MDPSERLVDKSALTRRQLQALRSYVRVAQGEMRYREAAATGTSKPVTIGSYFRTVQQARENVRESIVTVMIAIWLGVVKAEDVRRLLEVAGSTTRELSEEESARFAGVLQALIGKIVM